MYHRDRFDLKNSISIINKENPNCAPTIVYVWEEAENEASNVWATGLSNSMTPIRQNTTLHLAEL